MAPRCPCTAPIDGGLWPRPEGRWQKALTKVATRTTVDIQEKSESPELARIYLLDMSRFRDTTYTQNGRLRLAQDLYDAMKDDSSGDEPSLGVWGNGRTAGSNPKLRALVQEWLPAGWVTSRVNQRGWSAVQYCLTAPSGEWYYVRHSTIGGYDDTGRCRLDPDLPSVG